MQFQAELNFRFSSNVGTLCDWTWIFDICTVQFWASYWDGLHAYDFLCYIGLKFDLTSVSSREFSSVWSAALPYGIHRGSRAPTPLMLQHGSFGRLHRRHSESGETVCISSMSALLCNTYEYHFRRFFLNCCDQLLHLCTLWSLRCNGILSILLFLFQWCAFQQVYGSVFLMLTKCWYFRCLVLIIVRTKWNDRDVFWSKCLPFNRIFSLCFSSGFLLVLSLV